ncbi:MAG: ABC transporter permease [Candidatus Eisenbacteria sp.]|nr:ABC transporter permease [Candidatus Eisenbacteria bacterium]
MRRSGLTALAAVVVMSLSFLMLGLFMLLTVNLRHAVHLAQARVEIAAYVEENVAPDRVMAMADSLRQIPGIRSVEWISKEDALERFTEELGDDAALLESLEANPLPASFEIAIYDDYKTEGRVSSLAEQIRSVDGVEDVDSGLTWVAQLNRGIAVVAVLDLGFGLIVVFATVVSVGSAIKLALLSRRETIQVLKLVGATKGFIRTPFLIEGVIQGAAAAGIAALLLWGSYRFAVSFLPDFRFLSHFSLVLFVVLGTALGGIGAMVSLRGLLKEKAWG